MRFRNVALVAALLIQYSPSCQPFSSIDSRSHNSRLHRSENVEDKGSVVFDNHDVVVRTTTPIHMSKIDLDLSTDGDRNKNDDAGCSSPDHKYCKRKAKHNRVAAGIMGIATAQISVTKVCDCVLFTKLNNEHVHILCAVQTFYNETHCL